MAGTPHTLQRTLRKVEELVPRVFHRRIFYIFVSGCAALILFQFISASRRWHTSAAGPFTYATSVEKRASFSPVVELCASFASPHILTTGVISTLPLFFYGNVSAPNIAALDVGVSMASPMTQDQLEALTAGATLSSKWKVARQSIRSEQQYRYVRVLHEKEFPCMLLNVGGSLIATDDFEAHPYSVAVLSLTPMSPLLLQSPLWYRIHDRTDLLSDQDFVSKLRDSNSFTYTALGPRTLADIYFTQQDFVDIHGVRTSTFATTTSEYSTSDTLLSHATSTRIMASTLANASLYQPGLAMFNLKPTSAIVNVITEQRAYGFSQWIAEVGGVLGLLASAFALIFPTIVTQPRALRFAVCSEPAVAQQNAQDQTGTGLRQTLLLSESD